MHLQNEIVHPLQQITPLGLPSEMSNNNYSAEGQITRVLKQRFNAEFSPPFCFNLHGFLLKEAFKEIRHLFCVSGRTEPIMSKLQKFLWWMSLKPDPFNEICLFRLQSRHETGLDIISHYHSVSRPNQDSDSARVPTTHHLLVATNFPENYLQSKY